MGNRGGPDVRATHAMPGTCIARQNGIVSLDVASNIASPTTQGSWASSPPPIDGLDNPYEPREPSKPIFAHQSGVDAAVKFGFEGVGRAGVGVQGELARSYEVQELSCFRDAAHGVLGELLQVHPSGPFRRFRWKPQLVRQRND
jgi:hypothetical protein